MCVSDANIDELRRITGHLSGADNPHNPIDSMLAEWLERALNELERSRSEHRAITETLHSLDLRLTTIEAKTDAIDTTAQCVLQLKSDVAALKVKAGVWGLIGGAIPVGIGIALTLLK